MPWLQLVKIKCHDTEDTFGNDEVYIMVGEWDEAPDQVWGPVSMGEGDVEWLDNEVAPLGFESSMHIDVWDQDAGGPDEDDYLGPDYGLHHSAYSSDAGDGDKDLSFEGDGAKYTLTYRVTKEKPDWP